MPIRSLASRHRPKITSHLLALSESDRYLRFGYPASNEQIHRYVDALDFDRDELFGIFNRRLELIAMAHLAYLPVTPHHASLPSTAEFGVSVAKAARGRGYGARLFKDAMLRARNRGYERLFIHALSENVAMLKIARQAGAVVRRDGPESEAWLQLPMESLASQVDELVGQHAAEVDYQIKLNRRRFGRLLDMVAEVKHWMRTKRGRVASE